MTKERYDFKSLNAQLRFGGIPYSIGRVPGRWKFFYLSRSVVGSDVFPMLLPIGEGDFLL